MRFLTLCLLSMMAFTASATTVRFETNFGNIDIELFDEDAPTTVANFLNYVNDGDYDGTVIHRTDPGFIIQGGGYRFLGNRQFQPIPTDQPIVNESQRSNLLGTISMARTSDPNSATSQWFFNLANNTVLDESNDADGFAVFGQVVRGMDVLYIIESLLRVNFFDATPSGAFGQFPLYRFDEDSSNTIELSHVVEITKAYVLSETFQITEGISGAWVTPGINGQGLYMEVLPAADVMIMAWFTFDSTSPDPEVPSSIGDAGNRWLTASGTFQNNVFTGAIFKTSGGLFDSFVSVITDEVGTISVNFENCSNATMTYKLTDSGENNTIALQRISGVNVDFCESLATDAAPEIVTQ